MPTTPGRRSAIIPGETGKVKAVHPDASDDTVELAFIGDLMMMVDDIEPFFASAGPHLAAADIAVGHVELPHTRRGTVSSCDVPSAGAPPANLDALVSVGIDVVTLAANHIFDQGEYGVLDTVERLRSLGIASTGAGQTIDDARRPAVLSRKGLTFGFLSYNAVGPRESWATAEKAGAAPVRIHAHYELEMASPGSPPTEYTTVDVDSLQAMVSDIEQLADQVDIVTVSLHKGLVFERARLAQYESLLARAAIDAGADVVIGHHAHMPRGMEVYKGRPVFHGINHFITAYPSNHEPPKPSPSTRRSPILDLLDPDATMRAPFPYSRDARHTMIARVVVDELGVRSAGFTPCWIDDDAKPIVNATQETGAATADHVRDISREAGLTTVYEWAGDRVQFFEGRRLP